MYRLSSAVRGHLAEILPSASPCSAGICWGEKSMPPLFPGLGRGYK